MAYCGKIQSSVFYFMPDKDIESRLAYFGAEISGLKTDVRELVHLVEDLAALVQMPPAGTEEEKVAIQFEARLRGILEKHSRHPHHSTHQTAIEGVFLT